MKFSIKCFFSKCDQILGGVIILKTGLKFLVICMLVLLIKCYYRQKENMIYMIT